MAAIDVFWARVRTPTPPSVWVLTLGGAGRLRVGARLHVGRRP